MTEDFEIKGTWWLPDKPNKRIPGVLRFSNENGIALELHGSLRSNHRTDILVAGLIHGDTYQGKAVSIYDCFEIRNDGNSSVMVGNHIFIGKHFDSSDEMKFSMAQVSYEHLEEWLGGWRFERNLNEPPFSARHSPLPGFEAQLPSIDASLKLNYTISFQGDMVRTLEWKHMDYLQLCPSMVQDYSWFTNKLYALQLFLLLITGGIIRAKKVIGYGDIISEVNGIPVREEIEIYRVPTIIQGKNLDPWHILLRLPALKDNLPIYLDKWFHDAVLLAPVYALLWSIMVRHSTYHETIFLNLTQALEAFHRRVRDGMYLPEEQYEPIRDVLIRTIPNAIPQEVRESLKSRLRYGNEISLRNRLRDLLDGPVWEHCLMHFIKDRPTFIASVVDTRNYLVHYDKSLEQNALNSFELYHCNELLTLVLFMLLYQHVGIPIKMVYEAITQRGRFRSYMLEKRKHYYGTSLDNLTF